MNFTYLLRHYKLFRAYALLVFRCLCKTYEIYLIKWIFWLPFPSYTWDLGRHPKVIVNTQKFCLRDLRLIVNIIKKTNITNTYFLITLYIHTIRGRMLEIIFQFIQKIFEIIIQRETTLKFFYYHTPSNIFLVISQS